ncbi:MAG: AraC family transcriptional regulator [Bacteroidota bacterium]|nr:AraC family transcriptional regulator [Bacteroidota bacterium]
MIATASEIKSCYMGPAISPEQFIAEHFFLFLIKGKIEGYDGQQRHTLNPGEYCMVRKNHLARYNKQKDDGEFGKIVVVYDRHFLQGFHEKYKVVVEGKAQEGVFISLNKDEKVPELLHSLLPYYRGEGQIEECVAQLKREELLLILLQSNPGLSTILFDFGVPQKIDLEAFMNSNYKFNVRLEQLAFLTGRSLSAFKRDFKQLFKTTPSRWLIQRRLKEAHFLLEHNGGRPSGIYLDLGFEDLSHFSFVFKKYFGSSPGEVAQRTGK